MAFKDILILEKRVTNENGDFVVQSQKTVYADIKITSVSMQYKSEYADYRVDYQVIMWRNEFEKDNYTHAVYKGVSYNINNVGRMPNDRQIKLMLGRG